MEIDLQKQADNLRKSTEIFLKQMDLKATEINEKEQQLNSERESFEIEKKVMEGLLKLEGRSVKLDVGGSYFTTTIDTLQRQGPHMLSSMFSGRYSFKPNDDGRFFIDRDGTHFRYILNFLRDGTIPVPTEKVILQELIVEAQYYQVSDLLSLLGADTSPSPSSTTVKYQDKDFEEDGIIWNLLTDNGKQKYPKNPLESGANIVEVSVSSKNGNSTYSNLNNILARNAEGTFYTSNGLHSPWIELHFKTCKIKPTHYTLGNKSGAAPPRNWELQGSADGKQWTTLSVHKADHTLGGNLPHTFALNDVTTEYEYFRLVGTGTNCGTDPLIGISGIELYGTIINKEVEQ